MFFLCKRFSLNIEKNVLLPPLDIFRPTGPIFGDHLTLTKPSFNHQK